MAAVWFVVSVPSKKHEAKLASAPSLKKNSRSETEFATINEGTGALNCFKLTLNAHSTMDAIVISRQPVLR